MAVLLIKDGIRYEMLSELNLMGAVHCVSQVFTHSEPMSRHLGITPDEFKIFAQAYYSELIDEELSLVAIDEDSDQVIGVRMSEDYCKQEDEIFIENLSSKFYPLFALLESLGQPFHETHDLIPGKYVHLFMVAVDDNYTRRGIAPTMYKTFLRMVLKRGYTEAVTEPTGVISQHILRNKFGFRELNRIDYRSFEYEGGYPFEKLEGHACAMLMQKNLFELGNLLDIY